MTSHRPISRITFTLTAGISLATTVIGHAMADFVIEQTRQPIPIIDAPNRRSAKDPAPAVKTRTPHALSPLPDRAPPKPPVHPGYPIVEGFGTAIPLRQALPMIAPRYVTIHFAAGIDQTMPCSWRSGLPWPATINTAIAPLGLRIVATPTAISIVIKKSR